MIPIITIVNRYSYDCGHRYDVFYYEDKYVGADEEEVYATMTKLLGEGNFKLEFEEVAPW